VPSRKNTTPSTKMIHIRLTSDIHLQLKVETARKGTTIQEWVAKLIENNLSNCRGGK